jgi:hypothetical protein
VAEARDPFATLQASLKGIRARGAEVDGEIEAVTKAVRAIRGYMADRWADEPQVEGVVPALDKALVELDGLLEFAKDHRDE